MYIGEFQHGQRQGYGELRLHLDSLHNPNNRLRENIKGRSSREIVEIVLEEWDLDGPLIHSGNWNNNNFIPT